ncbi:MAG: peptidoglycan-binding protein [Clostridia bacterium]|nr:peptidoglycan-binding protein [Clostridia bacterium]
MKRKLLAVILAFTLLIPSVSFSSDVFYENSNDIYYLGANNSLFIPGEIEAIFDERIRGIVTAVDEVVYFIVSGDTDTETETDLATIFAYEYIDNSSDYEPVEIADIIGDAVWSEEDAVIYYVPQDDPMAIMAYNPEVDEHIPAARADGEIVGFDISLDGLIVKTDSSRRILVPRLGTLVEPESDITGVDSKVFKGGEIIINASHELSIRLDNVNGQMLVDTDVYYALEDDNNVYYLKLAEDSSSLMSYAIATGDTQTLYTYDEVMYSDLTCDGSYIYLTGRSGIIYQYSIDSGLSQLFASIDVEQVKQPYVVALSNLLIIYDYAADSDDRFVKKLDLNNYNPQPDVLNGILEDSKQTSETLTALSRGSRGDEVVRLQTRLKELGYLTGSVDGIFGSATLDAVMLVQEDMGYAITGDADEQFLSELYYTDVPAYERYKDLKHGDSGTRVTSLQERLRALYYMKEAADGKYGDDTVNAVILFQLQMGYTASGNITASQLRTLLSKNAEQYDGYLLLQRGDNAPAVKRLATRLKKLGYMTNSATNSYNKYVVQAVKLFESYNGLRQTGKATVARQEKIFSRNAKHYDPEPTPTPEPKYITEKQLKKMRNWMNNNLGTNYSKTQAIKNLQIRLMDLGFMAGSASGKYDVDTYNCVCEFQRACGLKVNGVANVDTLKEMFLYR